MPRINLLPWRETQRKDRRIKFLVSLGGAAVAALVATFAGYLLVDSMINSQSARNDRLRAQIKIVDKQIEEINDLESQKQRFIARMNVIDKLQRSRSEEVHLFDEVVNTLPDGTYLTSFVQNGRKLKFEGVAQSSTRVSNFYRAIDASQWMRNADLEVIESTAKNDNAGLNFKLSADETSTAADDEQAAGEAKPKHAGHGGGT
ncbi:MAG TPA: PilN domain-containing protein [Steroidobacteraceae bacterium]